MTDLTAHNRSSEATPSLYRVLHCVVNGRPVTKLVDVRASLLDMLRDDFRLTSVKKGCEVGECGACTVLVDGESFDACIYLAVWVDGKDVRTCEGLASIEGELNVAQQSFIDQTAVQCGFCTPGLLMSATELLETGKSYTRDELRVLLAGHLCRCTGYENIVNAVEIAMHKHLTDTAPDTFWDGEGSNQATT